MTYLPDVDYFVYYEKLPWSIHGMVSPNDDGTFSIILNSRISESMQRSAYRHEVHHIENDDFYNGIPIQIIEPRNIRKGCVNL